MDFLLTKKNLILYLIIILLLLLNIGFSVYVNYFNVQEEVKDNSIVTIEKEKEEVILDNEDIELSKYYVDIKGEVKKPGVYLVDKGSIINDVITLAGGLNKNASTKYINLSKSIRNEMVIYIYKKDELVEKKEVKEECICEEIKECIDNKESIIIEKDNDKVVEEKKDSVEKKEDSNIDSTQDNKVNINTADVNALQTLSGIGASKAEAIIEYRNTNGLFKSIEDIRNVSGIGDAAYEKIKDYITV